MCVYTTTSCKSEDSIKVWTSSFRSLYNENKITLNNLPHVIGSKRSFSTMNEFDLIKSSYYILNSIELIGDGQSTHDVEEFLKNPGELPFKITALNVYFGCKSNCNKIDGFKPVFNMTNKSALKEGSSLLKLE